MADIKDVLFRSLHQAFPNHHIDFDVTGLGATVNGYEIKISEEEVLNNQAPNQAIDLITTHVQSLRSRMAA